MKINRSQFSIEINAENSKIWKALWQEGNYREWAGIFFEGSYVVADNWEEGSTVHFLSPDQSGIYSRIEKHIPNEIIQFKHIGNVKEGKEQPLDNESRDWSGATEIYSLSGKGKHNKLTVDIDIIEEHVEFMTNTFPKALEKIKTLAEKS